MQLTWIDNSSNFNNLKADMFLAGNGVPVMNVTVAGSVVVGGVTSIIVLFYYRTVKE